MIPQGDQVFFLGGSNYVADQQDIQLSEWSNHRRHHNTLLRHFAVFFLILLSILLLLFLLPTLEIIYYII